MSGHDLRQCNMNGTLCEGTAPGMPPSNVVATTVGYQPTTCCLGVHMLLNKNLTTFFIATATLRHTIPLGWQSCCGPAKTYAAQITGTLARHAAPLRSMSPVIFLAHRRHTLIAHMGAAIDGQHTPMQHCCQHSKPSATCPVMRHSHTTLSAPCHAAGVQMLTAAVPQQPR
jgi:hypothetical protein